MGVGGSGGIVTLILNLKAHDQFHPPAAATPGKNAGIHYIEGWCGAGNGACVDGRWGERKMVGSFVEHVAWSACRLTMEQRLD
jgi:hypothetical protein